jgi:hypothetical protein
LYHYRGANGDERSGQEQGRFGRFSKLLGRRSYLHGLTAHNSEGSLRSRELGQVPNIRIEPATQSSKRRTIFGRTNNTAQILKRPTDQQYREGIISVTIENLHQFSSLKSLGKGEVRRRESQGLAVLMMMIIRPKLSTVSPSITGQNAPGDEQLFHISALHYEESLKLASIIKACRKENLPSPGSSARASWDIRTHA